LGITPCFEPLRLVPEAIGASVQEFSLTPQQDGWQLDLQAFLDRITAKTKLVVINFPHNPTGAHITEDMLQAIIEQCRRHDCWLFADEVFRGLEYSPEEQLPPVAASYEKGISLGVMSKAYGLGGVRIGWLACQDKQLLQRTMQIKRYLSICNGRTDEWLATIALQHANTLLQRNNSLIQQNMTLLKQSLPQLEDSLQWIEPKAGCVAFPRLLAVEAADDIADCLLQQHGVMIVPGRCFARQGLSAHFRIGFGLPNFSEAFRYFAALLSAS
ncbi:MAG: aminotransferase class I/II-fold pyridoxal phosphate-dependent enzyme, partial [Chromatiales bacterium]